MSARDDLPIFNLRAVVQETGVRPDTLRAWERRYGLPQPQRTSGGHRLYSQRDLNILKWLVARQEEGLSISNAVDLWNQLESEGQNPLHMPEYAAAQPPVAVAAGPVGETVAEMRDNWVAACLAFDEQRADQVLTQAFALYPVETVSFELLQEGLSRIGQGWYQGEVTVQQEHFASELAMRRLEALVLATPPPTRAERILAACPPGEDHVFSLLLLTLLLRRQGWNVLYLGANVPVERLETIIAAGRPQLTVSVAQQLHTAASLLEMAQALQKENVALAYGGGVFNHLPDLRDRIPGHFLGERLDMAPEVVDQVLASRSALPSAPAAPEAYQQALVHFREQWPAVGAATWKTLNQVGFSDAYLTQANQSLSRNISAALALGDMAYLGCEIEWVEGLLFNYQLPTELLGHYLKAYHQALTTHLDERGKPIITWLGELL
ncbi:MAG: MerR family transcriptional regulator [Anaerolineae bacterium]|nr:MAG: MerR family transcriptional regulator [Anaerolineae bacterium]